MKTSLGHVQSNAEPNACEDRSSGARSVEVWRTPADGFGWGESRSPVRWRQHTKRIDIGKRSAAQSGDRRCGVGDRKCRLGVHSRTGGIRSDWQARP